MRATFRPIVDGAPAWQRQLRDRVAEPSPAVRLDLRDSVVRPITRATAERVILRYEWLGTLPKTTRRHFGLFFGPYLAGVTSVGVGNIGGGGFTNEQFGIERLELAGLVRGACVSWAPPGANSRLIAWTVRLMRDLEPKAKLMIAFADSEAGEIGTVYQAAGWTYIGKSTTIQEWVAPNGEIRNNASVLDDSRRGRRSWAYMRRKLESEGWILQRSNPKGRYVVVLDRSDARLVDRVAAMALPYPKRPVMPPVPRRGGDPAALSGGEGESDDAPAIQAGEDASRRSRRSTRRTGGKA